MLQQSPRQKLAIDTGTWSVDIGRVPENRESPDGNFLLECKTVLNTSVIVNGRTVGRVSDAIVDLDQMKIEAFIVAQSEYDENPYLMIQSDWCSWPSAPNGTIEVLAPLNRLKKIFS